MQNSEARKRSEEAKTTLQIDELKTSKEQLAQFQRLAEWAWTIICNVDDGEFKQSDKWLVAMAKFRTEYHKMVCNDASIITGKDNTVNKQVSVKTNANEVKKALVDE